ncbi:MAG: ADP-ribosylglycohydrolase family protein [Oscillatoriales cyanobacterium]|nr:MAG: ADP-ribosylglycohydrolase family protein [Oscillatoriales cyanobacterium]
MQWGTIAIPESLTERLLINQQPVSIAQIRSGLLGLCVGDALGVPVEFSGRSTRLDDPVTGLRGWGTWNQPPGTWSDDSSLTLCLVDGLVAMGGPAQFSLQPIADRFCAWYGDNLWTARGEVFDVGGATARAINRLRSGCDPRQAGGTDERSNGNGALMRILPMAWLRSWFTGAALLDRVHGVACITHGHARSQIACGLYVWIALGLLEGRSPQEAYRWAIQSLSPIYANHPEAHHFDRLWAGDLAQQPIDTIRGSGYVVNALEAALWCLLTTDSYTAAVLQAVNLGEDTDTTAAIAGGLAGLCYGLAAIPADWLAGLARQADIVDLGDRLAAVL